MITRHGHPVATLQSIKAQRKSKKITRADIDWLDKHRVGKIMPAENAAETVRRLRDEDWAR